MSTPDYESELKSLRRSYVEAHPKQRFNVAKQRIQYPEHGPNLVVTSVSAVEGFARSLAMHYYTTDKAELSVLYPKYCKKSTDV